MRLWRSVCVLRVLLLGHPERGTETAELWEGTEQAVLTGLNTTYATTAPRRLQGALQRNKCFF